VSDGRLRWTVRHYWSAGVSANGRLLVSGTEDQGIAVLSITTGKKLWSKPWLWTALAANPAGDSFYLDDNDGGLVSIKAFNGAKIWAKNGTGGPMAADGKRVYRGFSNSVEALDARTGKQVWITRVGATAGQPVRAGGLLYTNVQGQGLTILTAATGAPASRWPFGTVQYYNVVVAGGRLLQIDGDTLKAYSP
jgi:outer membrane protein assembly factor BamB